MSARLIMDGKDLVVHNWQDCEDIVEDNKRMQNAGKQTGDFRKIASIPNDVLHQWLNEEWARGNTSLRIFSPEFDELVKRKLMDRDWLWLRTA